MSSKERLADLAIAGGTPAFDQQIHVGRPNLPDRRAFIRQVHEIFDRRWLTNNGACVQELERRIAEQLHVRHCVATCNGTVGLEIAVRALGLRGEVIVPSFTFIATAHALAWQGIEPVFCDVDRATLTIDPKLVEQLLTPRTTGILGVHLWGRTCDVEALEKIAVDSGLELLFDAAHAFGCTRGGQWVGNFGRAEVFSFHATKFFNTFEGGAIVTNNDELAKRMRLMRNFGFAGLDEATCLGTNGKMSEVSAAMGLAGLESLDGFVAVNRRHHETYCRSLEGIPGIELLDFPATEEANHQYVVMFVDADAAGLSRDELMAVLHAENVLARRYFYPGCHRMEPYRSGSPDAGRRLPVTESVAARVLLLPTGTTLADTDVRRVCEIVRVAVGEGSEIRRLARSAPR